MSYQSIDPRRNSHQTAYMALDDNLPADPFNRMEPRAPINIVPPGMQRAMLEAFQANPELFAMDETGLYQELRTRGRQISPTDNRLRLAFWLEYDRCHSESRPFQTGNVFGGVCTKQAFFANYLTVPDKVAWMLLPPVDYAVRIREAHSFGLDQMRAILAINAEANGKVNVKLMELQAKIFHMLDQREKGGYTQRQEIKQLSITASASQVQEATMEKTMAALNERLKALDKKEREAQRLPAPMEKEVVNES